MPRIIQKVSREMIQAIEGERLSRDQIIYYDNEHGWIYQQRDDDFINSVSREMEENSQNDLENRPLEKLGPFGTKPTKVSITILENVDVYQTVVDRNLNRLNIVDGYGQRGPIAPVTLTGQARDVAHIPRDATHFCWVYPLVGIIQLTTAKKTEMEREVARGNLEYTFLALGGFAYFRLERNLYKMLQTNCLVQADNGLIFQGPFPWRPEYTAYLERQGRFQNATISTLLELGIKYYCFINPSEKLKSSTNDALDWIPAPNGGFVYLYDADLEPHMYDRYFCISDTPLSEQISTHVMPFSLINKRNQSQTISNRNASISLANDANNKILCSICYDRTIRCIFIPCKHMCTCNECATTIRQRNNSVCPICRQSFREIWDVFI